MSLQQNIKKIESTSKFVKISLKIRNNFDLSINLVGQPSVLLFPLTVKMRKFQSTWNMTSCCIKP